jgi:hypothetical protein
MPNAHTGDGKASWADITDAEWKSMGLTAADLLKDPFKLTVDRDARSTEAPSSTHSSHSSDAEQDHGYKRRPMQFYPEPWVAQPVFQCGPQIQMIAVPFLPYTYQAMPYQAVPCQAMQCVMPETCSWQEDFSEMGPWAPYAYQAMSECPGAQGWWPSHLQCLPEEESSSDSAQPTGVGCSKLEKALAKARALASTHQRALNRMQSAAVR